MLSKVACQNFKSHVNVDVNLSQLVVLTGPNSSGKTTLMEAVRTVLSLKEEGKGLALDMPLLPTKYQLHIPSSIKVTFKDPPLQRETISEWPELYDIFYKFLPEIADGIFENKLSDVEIEISSIYGSLKEVKTKVKINKDEYMLILSRDKFRWEGFYEIKDEEREGEAPEYISKSILFLNKLVSRSYIDSNTLNYLEYWKSVVTEREVREKALRILDELISRWGFEVKRIPITELEETELLDKVLNFNVKLLHAGGGLNKIMPLMLALSGMLSSKSSKTLFVENPEMNLSPESTLSVIGETLLMHKDLIKEGGLQVILETHYKPLALLILRTLRDVSKVYLVYRNKEGTNFEEFRLEDEVVQPISKKAKDALKMAGVKEDFFTSEDQRAVELIAQYVK